MVLILPTPKTSKTSKALPIFSVKQLSNLSMGNYTDRKLKIMLNLLAKDSVVFVIGLMKAKIRGLSLRDFSLNLSRLMEPFGCTVARNALNTIFKGIPQYVKDKRIVSGEYYYFDVIVKTLINGENMKEAFVKGRESVFGLSTASAFSSESTSLINNEASCAEIPLGMRRVWNQDLERFEYQRLNLETKEWEDLGFIPHPNVVPDDLPMLNGTENLPPDVRRVWNHRTKRNDIEMLNLDTHDWELIGHEMNEPFTTLNARENLY